MRSLGDMAGRPWRDQFFRRSYQLLKWLVCTGIGRFYVLVWVVSWAWLGLRKLPSSAEAPGSCVRRVV